MSHKPTFIERHFWSTAIVGGVVMYVVIMIIVFLITS